MIADFLDNTTFRLINMSRYNGKTTEQVREMMRRDDLCRLQGIRESGFEEEFYSIVDDFKYRLREGYTATTVLHGLGYWRIDIEQKKIFSKKYSEIHFFASLVSAGKPNVAFQYTYVDNGYALIDIEYTTGKDVIEQFKNSWPYKFLIVQNS